VGLPVSRLRGACRRPPSAEAGAAKVEGSGDGRLEVSGWKWNRQSRSRRWDLGDTGRRRSSAVGVGSPAEAALVRGSGPGWGVGCFAAAEKPRLSTWALQKDHVNKEFRCKCKAADS